MPSGVIRAMRTPSAFRSPFYEEFLRTRIHQTRRSIILVPQFLQCPPAYRIGVIQVDETSCTVFRLEFLVPVTETHTAFREVHPGHFFLPPFPCRLLIEYPRIPLRSE